jgi:hypothetical protein
MFTIRFWTNPLALFVSIRDPERMSTEMCPERNRSESDVRLLVPLTMAATKLGVLKKGKVREEMPPLIGISGFGRSRPSLHQFRV